ncbi:ArsR/SmtB family transcription factor [Streptomyces liangshanensis]|uniref:ArsR/SmtB family transcription factor n=1 Tax=Streptomyces liangshanensis TaxID=2717324 RepID=UPI0036D7C545
MLRIHFTGEDLTRVTVATRSDPLWDVLLSLHLLQEPDRSLAFGEWRRRTRALRMPSVRPLLELARPWGYSPDFLTPGRGEADFTTQLDDVLSTSRTQLSAELSILADESGSTPWIHQLAGGDRRVMARLGDALTAYHRVALAPYQERIAAHAEADRARRGLALVTGGVERLLAELHPRVTWEAPVLRIPVYADQDVHLEGRGLVLVPSFFCRIQPITLMDPGRPPVLVYPLSPRLGWLRPTGAEGRQDGLEPVVALLGRTRAHVLDAAAAGGTTTELALRVGVALPVISRQTSVLREAGLLDTRREGGSVRHHVTPLGLALLNGELAPDGTLG